MRVCLLASVCLLARLWTSSCFVRSLKISNHLVRISPRECRSLAAERGPNQQLVLDTELLKRSIALSTLFRGYGVELTPLGPHKYRCLCPFHGDQDPSMLVNDEPAYFYCFSCGATGNVVNFVAKREKLTYSQTTMVLKSLIEKEPNPELSSHSPAIEEEPLKRLRGILHHGEINKRCALVPIPNTPCNPSVASMNTVIKPTISPEQIALSHRILKEASEFFSTMLMEGPEALLVRKYLEERGLSPATIATFGLGFSPSQKLPCYFDYTISTMAPQSPQLQNRSLTSHLLARSSLTLQDLVNCGLTKNITNVKTGKNTFYDRFRNRLMIPIRDQRGNCIAFGARSMEDYKENKQIESTKSTFVRKDAKYINSPTTAVFEKKLRLFGVDVAQAQCAKLDFVIMVEGYFDVISLYEAGVHNVVGALGTAINIRQLINAAKLTSSGTVVLLLDGDAPGQEASRRAAALPARHEQQIRRKGLTADQDLPTRKLVLKVANISDSLEFIRLHHLRSKKTLSDGELKIKDCADIFEHFSGQETKKILQNVVHNAVEVFSGDLITGDVIHQ